MKGGRWVPIGVWVTLGGALGASPAAAQNAGPALLGDSLAPAERSAEAVEGARAQPFEVWSVGRVASRYRRTGALVPTAAAPVRESSEPVSSPAAAAISPPGASSAAGTPSAPARPATPLPATAAAAAGSRIHRVEWGETWLGIARQYGVSDSNLRSANPGVDPERIRSGQVVRIPAGGAAAQRMHHVAAGETLSGLARRYGVSSEAIRRANRLENDLIRTGQTLVIPGS